MKKFILVFLVASFLLTSCNHKVDLKNEISKNDDEKIVATWITYYEIKEMIEKSDSEEVFRSIVNNRVYELKKYSVNNIFIHARAFDDCFYKSKIYPVSNYGADENGNLKFDILHIFIDICKSFNIKVHAWINPYRIRNDTDISKIPHNSFAYKLINEKSEKVIITDNTIYYNPSYKEVQAYILNGVKEIIETYSVDGIHIDDYFYPTTNANIDSGVYNEYKTTGGSLSLEDFRRENVNSLVSSIYSLVKSYDENICFSISPNGDLFKNLNEFYADVRLWMTSDGYTDYIIPQIYFGFNNENMAFEKTLYEWTSIPDINCKLVIGLGLYKSGKTDKYAGNGQNEWIQNSNIISNQIKMCLEHNADGFSFYSSDYLLDFNENTQLNNERENIINMLEYYVT